MPNNVPVILLKELVILPNQEIKIELNNKVSKNIIKYSTDLYKDMLLVVAPLDTVEEEPSSDDLPKVGVIAKIKNKLQLPNGNIRVVLRGITRVVVNRYYNSSDEEDILKSEVEKLELPKYDKTEETAVRRKLISTLKEYISSAANISNSILNTINDNKDLNAITDIITSFLPFNVSKKLEYMQTINPLNRAIKLISDLKEEIEVIKLDDELDDLVSEELEQNQREYLLKEKLKAIKSELGESSLKDEELKKFKEKLAKLKVNKEVKNKIDHEIEKYEVLNESSPEIGVLSNYIDWILNLPWNKTTKENSNFNDVKKALDKTHFGLDEVKMRIVEYVAVKNINNNIKSPIICLIGPPGVGKTSIAMSIADALNRKFYKISVGGLNDSTELVGSRRTYLGANPGKIIQGLKRCEVKNPVFLIDEVDKMVKDYKGDPASTLLEIIDPVQNKYFVDNYIEEPFDLSNILFILTANDINSIPLTILDRVEVINLNSYTLFEKKDIAKKYILPRIIEEHKIVNEKLKISDSLIYFIIKNYTKESGVRDLERVLTNLIRKIAINNVKTLNEEKIIKLLGRPKYEDTAFDINNIGIVNMLAVNNSEGLVTQLEVIKNKGNGNIKVTGLAGESLNESVTVSLDYLKNAYNISLGSNDLHIHFLTGGIKKDGTSAGVSITVALHSIFEKKEIPKNIAFTGEISLNGEILRIGGLKEKLIAAYNYGIDVVYIPNDNKVELEDIPIEIKNKIDIIPVKNYKEIYSKIFK